MTRDKHIVVCGAGIIGLCCAYSLMRRGHRVTIVERGPEDHDCCATGSAGMLVPSHFIPLAAPGVVLQGLKWMFESKSPFYVRPRLDPAFPSWALRFMRASTAERASRAAPVLRDLSLASRRLYEELADLTHNEIGLEKRGLLMLCKTQHALDDEAAVAERAHGLGLPAEVVSPSRAAELDPDVHMDVAGGVYFQLDCHLTPQRLLSTLQRLLREGGVEFLWQTEVTGWRLSEGRVSAARISTDEIGAHPPIDRDPGRASRPRRASAHRGRFALPSIGKCTREIEADEFVLAGGSWSPVMVRSLGLRLPMQPGKGYSMTLSKPRQLPRLCSILSEARVAVTPMGSALRVGGTMELSGFDTRIRSERVRQIAEAMPRYFPDFRAEDFDGVPPWSGFRPCSPDGLPYVGRFNRYSNLTAAAGHAMLGLSLGPVTGQLVAELLSGETPSIPIEALNPDRYG